MYASKGRSWLTVPPSVFVQEWDMEMLAHKMENLFFREMEVKDVV